MGPGDAMPATLSTGGSSSSLAVSILVSSSAADSVSSDGCEDGGAGFVGDGCSNCADSMGCWERALPKIPPAGTDEFHDVR